MSEPPTQRSAASTAGALALTELAAIPEEEVWLASREIGAALDFLELDGLIAPSARWQCDNLMIYQNHPKLLLERLEVIEQADVNWQAWGREYGLINNE